jgi:hypothetical protein
MLCSTHWDLPFLRLAVDTTIATSTSASCYYCAAENIFIAKEASFLLSSFFSSNRAGHVNAAHFGGLSHDQKM